MLLHIGKKNSAMSSFVRLIMVLLKEGACIAPIFWHVSKHFVGQGQIDCPISTSAPGGGANHHEKSWHNSPVVTVGSHPAPQSYAGKGQEGQIRKACCCVFVENSKVVLYEVSRFLCQLSPFLMLLKKEERDINFALSVFPLLVTQHGLVLKMIQWPF